MGLLQTTDQPTLLCQPPNPYTSIRHIKSSTCNKRCLQLRSSHDVSGLSLLLCCNTACRRFERSHCTALSPPTVQCLDRLTLNTRQDVAKHSPRGPHVTVGLTFVLPTETVSTDIKVWGAARGKGEGKGKGHPRTGHEDPERE